MVDSWKVNSIRFFCLFISVCLSQNISWPSIEPILLLS